MDRLILRNGDDSIRVEYKIADSLSSKFGRFTVHEIVGLEDSEVQQGIDFRLLDYRREAFEQFATDNSLQLQYLKGNDEAPEILVAL